MARAPRLNASGKPNRPPTEFESRLYALCKRIPKGCVSTYGAMASVLHSAPRAVGQALRRNPFAPEVPCHRVIAASMALGGFNGEWGPTSTNVCRKRDILEKEGVLFDADGHLMDKTMCLDAGSLTALAKGLEKEA